MPSAIQELRDEFGVDCGPVISFLEAAGYELRDDGYWKGLDRKPTEKELRAVNFLFQEWDFGGIVWENESGKGKSPLVCSDQG